MITIGWNYPYIGWSVFPQRNTLRQKYTSSVRKDFFSPAVPPLPKDKRAIQRGRECTGGRKGLLRSKKKSGTDSGAQARTWGRGDLRAHLFVLLHRGGQREPVRHTGDHRKQHHLHRLQGPNTGRDGRRRCPDFLCCDNSYTSILVPEDPAACVCASRWGGRKLALERSTTGPQNWLPTENHNYQNTSSAVSPSTFGSFQGPARFSGLGASKKPWPLRGVAYELKQNFLVPTTLSLGRGLGRVVEVNGMGA